MEKEKIIEFAVLRKGESLQTEIRDTSKIWEIYGFLKVYIEDLEAFLLSELEPRKDNDKDLY